MIIEKKYNWITKEGFYNCKITKAEIVDPKFFSEKYPKAKDIKITVVTDGDEWGYWQSALSAEPCIGFYEGKVKGRVTLDKLIKIGWRFGKDFSEKNLETLKNLKIRCKANERQYDGKTYCNVVGLFPIQDRFENKISSEENIKKLDKMTEGMFD